jgi:predicted Zn-dependent peptidase
LTTESVDHRLMVKPVVLNRDKTLDREDPNGRVASFCLGFAAPRLQDPEYPAFRVLAYYLGEYMHYFEALRVNDALFYTGEVYYNYLEKPMAPNIVFLALTDPDSLETVQTRTLDLVRQLTNSGIEQAEINKVVAAMISEGEARSVAGKGSATLNALSYFLQNQLLYDENLRPKLQQVTTADIQKAAAKYFKHYIRVAYVPKELPDNF